MPLPSGEVAAKPTEKAQLCAKNPLTRYRGSSRNVLRSIMCGGSLGGMCNLRGDGLCPMPALQATL